MVTGFEPRKRSRCVRVVAGGTELWSRPSVSSDKAAKAGSHFVLPGCGGEVALRLEAVRGPMTWMAGVGPCEAAEAGPAGVLGQVAVREALSAVVLPGGIVGSGGLVALVH